MKTYIVWCHPKGEEPCYKTEFVRGKNTRAAKNLFKLLYPNQTIDRMRVWH